jgi:hypothetical protein
LIYNIRFSFSKKIK